MAPSRSSTLFCQSSRTDSRSMRSAASPASGADMARNDATSEASDVLLVFEEQLRPRGACNRSEPMPYADDCAGLIGSGCGR